MKRAAMIAGMIWFATCFGGNALADDAPSAPASGNASNTAGASNGAADTSAIIDPSIPPLTNLSTLGIVSLDLTRVDLHAMKDWETSEMKSQISDPAELARAEADSDRQIDNSIAWSENFTHAGGKTLYVLVDLTVLSQVPPVLAAPLAPGADAKAIAGLMQTGTPTGESGLAAATKNGQSAPYAEAVGDAMVWADAATHDQLKQSPGSLRAELAGALATAGDSPIRVAFSPTFPAITMLGRVMPNLPASLGGGPTLALMNGLKYMAVGLTPPPKAHLAMTFQCRDAASAANVAGVLQKALDQLKKMPPEGRQAVGDPDVLAQGLAPVVDGDKVTIIPDAKTTAALQSLLMTATVRSRRQAERAGAMSHMRQLLMGCYQYANAHDGEFPDQLNIVAGYLGGADHFATLMQDPQYPDEKEGFTYIKPPAKLGNFPVDTTVVIYENVPPTADTVSVGFADGHATTVTPDQLKGLLGGK